MYYLLAILLIILIYMYFEASLLKVERLNISKKGIKIIHLSDIHYDLLRVNENKVINIIKQENPDLVLISGDSIDSLKKINKFEVFLKNINYKKNVFLTLGNHENRAILQNKKFKNSFLKVIKNSNTTLLHNQSKTFTKNNLNVNIVGIDDCNFNCDTKEAFKNCNNSYDLTIVISHNPDIILKLDNYQFDLLLCGHFHGGQIWMPFSLEYKLLRKDVLCKNGYRQGLYHINNNKIYINRGIGNVLVPLRFLSRPELTVVNL